MNKIVRFIQVYLLCALPFVIALMAWETIHPQKDVIKNASIATRILWELLAYNLMFWFAVLVLYLIILVLVPKAREKTLSRLANLRERDEREQYITGKAARAAYISTLSLMIFFLFCSILKVEIYRVPKSEVAKEQLGVGISLGFSLLDKSQPENKHEGAMLFNSDDFSLSKPAIILILLSWQLLVFNITARKEQ